MPEIRRSPLAAPTEIALVLISVVTAIGFQRLFADTSYLGPVLVFAGIGHLLAIGLRRARVPSLATIPIAVISFIILSTWTFYRDSIRNGLPSVATIDALRADMTEGIEVFNAVVAPAPATNGFIVATALGFWITAFFADWSAFRLRAPFESTLPAAGLFVFTSVLGSDLSRYLHTGLFITSVLTFLLLYRVASQTSGPGWVRGDASQGTRALLSLGVKLVAVAIAISVLAGPLLPGAEEPPLLAWRDVGGEGGKRTVISPLVNIGSRLIDESDTEFFTVRVTGDRGGTYWRATPLDEFNGTIWTSQGSFKEAGDSLPSESDGGGLVAETLIQEFEIGPAFGEIWVPAALEARNITSTNRSLRWERRSSTLIVEGDSAAGAAYTIESQVPIVTGAALNATNAAFPAEILNGDGKHGGYLTLPDNFSPDVRRLAQDVTAGATTPIQKARVLQDYFRAPGSFTYDLSPERVADGQDSSAIESFLFQRRTGFCVHFAGSYAAMARAVGLPSRVAYGFTQGETDPNDPNLFHVTGKYLHAWPEVYIPDYGWLGFEPTPSRGMPGAEDYTGVAPAQEGPNIAPPPTSAPSQEQPRAPEPDLASDIPEDVGATSGLRNGGRGVLGLALLVILPLLLVIGVVLGYVLGVPFLRRTLRKRRRAAATTPNARVSVAWTESTESLSLVGVQPGRSETHHEYAERVDEMIDIEGSPHRQLAADMIEASYSGSTLSTAVAERAEANAEAIETHIQERIGRRAQVQRELDPRDLISQAVKRATRK